MLPVGQREVAWDNDSRAIDRLSKLTGLEFTNAIEGLSKGGGEAPASRSGHEQLRVCSEERRGKESRVERLTSEEAMREVRRSIFVGATKPRYGAPVMKDRP